MCEDVDECVECLIKECECYGFYFDRCLVRRFCCVCGCVVECDWILLLWKDGLIKCLSEG